MAENTQQVPEADDRSLSMRFAVKTLMRKWPTVTNIGTKCVHDWRVGGAPPKVFVLVSIKTSACYICHCVLCGVFIIICLHDIYMIMTAFILSDLYKAY